MNNRTIAPMNEPIQPAVCSPRPSSVVARKPPTNEPAMPNRIVTIQPPGSRPGMRNLAIAPTIRPNKSHPRMFMYLLQANGQRDADGLIDEQQECRVRRAASALDQEYGSTDPHS